MRNKLLITTALVAVLGATNAYAQAWVGEPDKDFVINNEQTLSDKELYYYKTIQIGTDGSLNISNSNIKTTVKDAANNDIVINGKLNLSNGSVLESGNDDDSMPNNSNMLIENATVDMQDSDLEANGNIIIKDTNLTSSNLVPESAGIWADGNITIEGGETNLNNSYLDSGGDIIIQSGTIHGSGSSDIRLSSDGQNKHKLEINGGDITLEDYAGIFSSGKDGQYNTLAADTNINGGNITVKDGREITLTGNADMNIGGNANIAMDYSGISPDNAHDGGILHEGQSGDINISGGTINLTGEVAKIERGGYDGDWIYSTTGETLMSEDDFYAKTGKDLDQATDEEIQEAGLNPDELDLTSYHTSTGNINITGGEINLKDGARISTTYKNEGDINISGGKINVSGSSAEIASAGNINIFNGAEINIASGSTLYAKVSAEDMEQAQKATLWVADNDTRFNIAGTLSANINGDDCGKIHLQNSNAKIDGNVKGASLIFEDSHTLSEAVTGTVGGLDIFEIQKGTLTYDKELDGGASSVVVGEGATLDIGANELHSGGDKEVDGEGVHFKDNSTLKFTVTDKDNYGKIYANYVNISKNGTTLDMSLNSAALKEGDKPLTLKLFNGEDSNTVEIEGKFANLTSNSRYDFADNGDGTYTVTANGTTASDIVADAGGTASNASTAEAWDSVSVSDSSPTAAAVTEKLAQLAGSKNATEQQAYVAALTAVAPEVAPMVQKTQTETANQVFSAVSTRLTGGSISTGSQGMSSGDSNPDAAVWVQGMYNHSELDDTSKAKGFDADSAGVAMGIEKNIGRAGKVGAGYAYTNTDIDGFMRSTDVDTHTAILYGEYKPNNWYVNGIATYGWSDYSEDKSVAGVGVKADYDVETLGLQAMTGYDMQFKNFGLTPEAGLRYVHIKQDAYTDSADQHVSGNDSDILTGVIGAKVNKTFVLGNGMLIKPEARIAATYDLFNDDVNSVVTLANGSAYAVDGEALDRFGMEFGAGVTAEVNDNIEFSLGYEGKFREDYTDHTGLINAKYKF